MIVTISERFAAGLSEQFGTPVTAEAVATALATRPDLAERRALAATPVTVNGDRAVIGGVRREFAVITRMSDGASWEWSWHAVRLVVARGGAFRV